MTISVVVTGGSGFVGSLILDAIQERHHDWALTVLDIQKPSDPRPKVEYLQVDLLRESDIDNAIATSKPEVVIHCANIVPPLVHRHNLKSEAEVISINVDGTRRLLKSCKQHGVRIFVWTGSCTAVTDDVRYSYRNINEIYPTSTTSFVYGKSKALGERIVLAANSNPTFVTCALRPSVLFGPGDYQLVPSIHACIAKGETPFMLGDTENLWDVTYAPNVAYAHVLAVENLLTTKTAAGEAIFIQNNEPITFRDFCLEVWKNFDHYPPFEIRIPFALASLAGYVLCLCHRSLDRFHV